MTPKPRDQQDGYKDPPRPPGTGAPCGVSRKAPPTQPETSYRAGAKLTVQWTETINHPGCFVIDFASANDANFQILGTKAHSGTSAPQNWTLDVTLPSTPCTGCTLRLRQLMLSADLPAASCPPATIPTGDTYYSCANVTLGGGSAGTGGATSSSGGATSSSGGATSSSGGASATGSSGAVGIAGSPSNGGAMSAAAGAPATAGAATTAPGSGGSTGGAVAASGGSNDGTSKGGMPSSGGAGTPADPSDQQSGGCAVSVPGGLAPASLSWLAALALTVAARRRRSSKRKFA